MDHPCKTCGQPVVRVNEKRLWPHKCPDCKKKSQREYGRSYRERTRNRIDWSGLKCGLCGCETTKIPRRGRPSKWCQGCLRKVRTGQSRTRKQIAKAEGRDKIHAGHCSHCHTDFLSDRRNQKYCSPQCARIGSRKKVAITCKNPACGKEFVRCEAQAANGRKYCSWGCFQSVHAAPPCTCCYCKKEFKARPCSNEWQGKNKYCSRDCYLDDRWGKDRPSKKSSPAVVGRACRRSLATSLRKKCKHFGVPFDPACTREAVCERDGWVCQQCGIKCHKGRHRFNKRTRKTSARNAEHDHIVPLSRRDPAKGNTFDNSQCLCRRCNGRKHARGGGQMRLALVEC
jgi:hypothetical protein